MSKRNIYLSKNNLTNQYSEAIAWAKNTLGITCNKSCYESKVIVDTPWSCVIEIKVGSNTVYLKQTPENIALEALIIKYLQDKFKAKVPHVISYNKELRCFLMKNAGISLRSILKKCFNMELMCRAILQFTDLQIEVENSCQYLLDLGVPDWRLNKFTDLLYNLFSERELLISDGLSFNDISKLNSILPKVAILCKQLSNHAIRHTIVQCDFHDNNIFFDEKTNILTHID